MSLSKKITLCKVSEGQVITVLCFRHILCIMKLTKCPHQKSHFSQHDFSFFPGRNFHFGRPKKIFSGLKKVLSYFKEFPPSLFQFFSFSSPFCPFFFTCLVFPLSHQKFPAQKSFQCSPATLRLLRHY